MLPQSGYVIYSIKSDPIKTFKNAQLPIEMQKIISKLDNEIPSLEFELKFNKKNSLFFMKPSMNQDGSGYIKKLAVISTQGNSTFFNVLDKKLIIKQTSFLGKDYLIQIPTNSIKWKLINEQKQIGDYVCYKAITTKETNGPLKEKFKYITHTVWYCPTITFNYGPYEIAGLPGLVLEFSNGQYIYTASEIKLSQKEVKIDKPLKGEVITKDEFENLGKKAFENKDFIRN
jgi:GLPGLI family protein